MVSEYCARAKKDGNVRTCVDYKDLNKTSAKDNSFAHRCFC